MVPLTRNPLLSSTDLDNNRNTDQSILLQKEEGLNSVSVVALCCNPVLVVETATSHIGIGAINHITLCFVRMQMRSVTKQ